MRIYLTLIALFLSTAVSALSPGDFADSYTIVPVGSGVNGNPLVKVTFDVKKTSEYYNKAILNAVHGIIFYGYEAASNSPAQSPLFKADDATNTTDSYFKSFFDNNTYKKFIVSVAENNVEVVKSKKGYRVGVIVCVDKRHLRKELEQAGVIRKLGDAIR